MRGPGKYDEYATDVRHKTMAEAVILIVLNGVHGSGFSMQADEATSRRLPELLENWAKQIRANIEKSDALDIRKAP